MKISELIELINGQLITSSDDLDHEFRGAMGADLMSDVLASIQPEAALLTGLCNPQVVRTALIADVKTIVFVRGKNPAEETIRLADEENIPLITTPLGMFETCGILYKAGLASSEQKSDTDCAS